MDDDSKMSFFFLGLGLGAALGVLFAPKSGSETRDFLMSKANESADLAKRRAQELKDQANETIERGQIASATAQRELVGGGGRRTPGLSRHGESTAAGIVARLRSWDRNDRKPARPQYGPTYSAYGDDGVRNRRGGGAVDTGGDAGRYLYGVAGLAAKCAAADA